MEELKPRGAPFFGVYVHVPFCSSRCGYCDFNTYTPRELGSAPGTDPDSYLDALGLELALATESDPAVRPADTVFVGGGTPSMLGSGGLTRLLSLVRDTIGIAPGAEITTESNPESTSPLFFEELLEAGFTRVSLGMQSATSSVLKVLGRRHTPGRATAAAREALSAGFAHVNLDMIYGTPTETDDDVRATLEAIVATGVDHVSAYSLIVEEGTAMARKVSRGELPAPDEDTYADRYQMIDEMLEKHGFSWYEVSNWSRPGGQCRHNLGYWQGGNWWGAGPGAHSHLNGRRFVNVKHPATYAKLLATGVLPIKEEEQLSPLERHEEDVMLALRLKTGIDRAKLLPGCEDVLNRFEKAGLLTVTKTRVAVTAAGRLLADGMIGEILCAENPVLP